eukprot:TRINITY_DN16371_c0_g1_i1.p1 TRINITY_DN16371_c0_g1~~TRINITY_DN16371_c0_g1_i1.p1  ORF type:complete len:307 (+),score=56.89 TRINITY_DN16371_c0_g1_i1:61-981(+)
MSAVHCPQRACAKAAMASAKALEPAEDAGMTKEEAAVWFQSQGMCWDNEVWEIAFTVAVGNMRALGISTETPLVTKGNLDTAMQEFCGDRCAIGECPFKKRIVEDGDAAPVAVPLAVNGKKYVSSQPTIDLLESIGGKDRLVLLMMRFYPKCFRDKQITKFFEDQNDPHAERLAHWVAEKMSGEPYWSSETPHRKKGQPHDRTSAHFKAWRSPKRERSRYGDHFKLDDAVMWMRLMFWSCREEGLDVEPFFTWYVQFIGHFIRVYEKTAPPYTWDAAEWSTVPENLAEYEANGWFMSDAASLRPGR